MPPLKNAELYDLTPKVMKAAPLKGSMLPTRIAQVIAIAAITALPVACAPVAAEPTTSEVSLPTPRLPEIKETLVHEMVAPPFVPKPITRKHSARVIVNLEAVEKTMEIADGATYEFWTFGGQVPGNFLRVREGDLVEFHLSNHHDNKIPHNIDLHAVTGPGGGAVATVTMPGQENVFTFRALNPGLYVYHCAFAPIPLHIANGMYGLILVEPKEGLPQVDKEFYVMQGDFYTQGRTMEPGFHAVDYPAIADEKPTYVLFNGRVGALTGDNSLKAAVGDGIRLFMGNGGPNLVSSFHVIGEVFDRVYGEGGTMVNQRNVQTTLVPAGGAAMLEFRADVPGSLHMVDHSISRATSKGAMGTIEIQGAPRTEIFEGKPTPGSGH